MKTYILIFLIISSTLTVLSIIFDSKKLREKRKTIIIVKDISFIVSILLEIFTYIGDIPLRKTLSIIFISLSLLIDIAYDIYQEISSNKKNVNARVITHMASYALLLASMKSIHGFSFVELIIFSAFSILFYLSTYFLKRRDDRKSVSKFFIYTLIISYMMSSAFSPLILSDTESGASVIVLMLIGCAIIYTMNMFSDGDLIFREEKWTSGKYSRIFVALEEISSMLILSSLLLIH